MVNEKRLIEIPSDGIVRIPIMRGADTVGEKRIDLSHIPTVDTVEVVHGEWAIFEDDWNSEVIYECSVCKEAFVTLDGEPMEKLWNYCPNCGAKMDGDRNG